MTKTLIKNIGEYFTGDLAAPEAMVSSLLISAGLISELNPPVGTSCDRELDANGLAVLPGLVDGHVHPVLGEWTPVQDTIGWIGS